VNAATALSNPPVPMPTFASAGTHPVVHHVDDAWWVELFGWKTVCDDEPTSERLMRQASLLALLSVA
jgi:hypothetical protein